MIAIAKRISDHYVVRRYFATKRDAMANLYAWPDCDVIRIAPFLSVGIKGGVPYEVVWAQGQSYVVSQQA